MLQGESCSPCTWSPSECAYAALGEGFQSEVGCHKAGVMLQWVALLLGGACLSCQQLLRSPPREEDLEPLAPGLMLNLLWLLWAAGECELSEGSFSLCLSTKQKTSQRHAGGKVSALPWFVSFFPLPLAHA